MFLMGFVVDVPMGIIWLPMEPVPLYQKDAHKSQVVKDAPHVSLVTCFREESVTKSTPTVSCTINQRDNVVNASTITS